MYPRKIFSQGYQFCTGRKSTEYESQTSLGLREVEETGTVGKPQSQLSGPVLSFTLMTSCWALAAPEPPEPGSSSWQPPPDGDNDEDDDSNDDDNKNDNDDDENNSDRNRNEHWLLSASHAFS